MELTPKQLKMLQRFADGGTYTWFKSPSDDEVMLFLIEAELITPRADIQEDYYRITQAGRIVLQASQKSAYKETQQQRQQHFENKVSVINLIIPVLTFIAGLVVEHFVGIVGLIGRLFFN